MKWRPTDFDTYTQSKDYIDTAIIPLLPVSWEDQMKSIISMGEYTSILCGELERQLTGRVYLFPPLTYLNSESKEMRSNRVLDWKKQISENGLKFVFFITSDPTWRDQDESIILLPSIPLENMGAKYRNQIIEEQMNVLLKSITKKWQETV